jgi:hypothetical protein
LLIYLLFIIIMCNTNTEQLFVNYIHVYIICKRNISKAVKNVEKISVFHYKRFTPSFDVVLRRMLFEMWLLVKILVVSEGDGLIIYGWSGNDLMVSCIVHNIPEFGASPLLGLADGAPSRASTSRAYAPCFSLSKTIFVNTSPVSVFISK